MRVIFLTHNYPRTVGDISGGFLHPLALALQQQGVDIRVIAPADRGSGGHSSLDGIPIERVRYDSPAHETLAYTGNMATAAASLRGILSFRRMVRAMRKAARTALQSSEPTLIHAHWWVPGGMASPRGAPLVITCHGTDVRLLERFEPAVWLGRSVLQRARVVTTVSGALAQVISSKCGVTVPDHRVVPMPLPEVERPLSSGGGGLVVVGRLSAQKRVHLAIEAYQKLIEQGFDLPLTIVGDGAERDNLTALVSRLGLSGKVHFTGAIPPATVPFFLSRADLALMPAQNEGLGLAGAEALIQGVPLVICRDGGGLLDLFPEGSSAAAIAAPNATGLARAALSLLQSGQAASAAAELGAGWRARLTPEHVAQQCLGWYAEALP